MLFDSCRTTMKITDFNFTRDSFDDRAQEFAGNLIGENGFVVMAGAESVSNTLNTWFPCV